MCDIYGYKISIHVLAGGWSLPGVQETYYHYEAAGDQHVGRTITGLPTMSELFAILPPFWLISTDPEVQLALSIAFPGLPAHLRRVSEFLLASVVYHHSWLRETLPSSHPCFNNPLFMNKALLDSLSSKVVLPCLSS